MSANYPAYPADENADWNSGLTKRELFALEMAKAQRIAHPNASSPEVANMGVVDADALLDLLAQLSTAESSAKEPT